jgi:hypothetical protein
MEEGLLKINNKLTNISQRCQYHSEFFLKKSKKFSIINTVLNIINISVTTITGLLSTFTASTRDIEGVITPNISYISSVLLYSSACINSIQQFLKLESLSEASKTTAMRFSALRNNIDKYLYTNTNMENKDYLKWVMTEYETILSHENMVEKKVDLNNIENPDSNTNNILSNTDKSQPHYQYEIDRYLVSSYSISY